MGRPNQAFPFNREWADARHGPPSSGPESRAVEKASVGKQCLGLQPHVNDESPRFGWKRAAALRRQGERGGQRRSDVFQHVCLALGDHGARRYERVCIFLPYPVWEHGKCTECERWGECTRLYKAPPTESLC